METKQMQGGEYLKIEYGEFHNITAPYRRTGNTTRLADFYVQTLFSNPNKWIHVFDYEFYNPDSEFVLKMDRRLADIIEKRLKFEHGIDNKSLVELIYADNSDGRTRHIVLLKLISNEISKYG